MVQRGKLISIDIKRRTMSNDSEGFATETLTTLTPTIRAWHEAIRLQNIYGGSEFQEATDRFIFRKSAAPLNFSSGDIVSTHTIPAGNYEIIRGYRDIDDRGMYLDIICKQVTDKIGG